MPTPSDGKPRASMTFDEYKLNQKKICMLTFYLLMQRIGVKDLTFIGGYHLGNETF